MSVVSSFAWQKEATCLPARRCRAGRNPRLVTILLKTASDSFSLAKPFARHYLLKGKSTVLFKLLDVVMITKGSTSAQAGKKSLLSVFLTENRQEPRNQAINPMLDGLLSFYPCHRHPFGVTQRARSVLHPSTVNF
jgi:hypothetical protein